MMRSIIDTSGRRPHDVKGLVCGMKLLVGVGLILAGALLASPPKAGLDVSSKFFCTLSPALDWLARLGGRPRIGEIDGSDAALMATLRAVRRVCIFYAVAMVVVQQVRLRRF